MPVVCFPLGKSSLKQTRHNTQQQTTGIFEITDDESGEKFTFNRINDLRESYQAAVLVVARQHLMGRPWSAIVTGQDWYWDYWVMRKSRRQDAKNLCSSK